MRQQVVEVDHAAAALQPLVGLDERGVLRVGKCAAPTRLATCGFVAIGAHHARPRPVEIGERGKGLDLQRQLRENFARQTDAIVRNLWRCLVSGQRPIAQQAQRHAVKRCRLNWFANVEAA